MSRSFKELFGQSTQSFV